MKASAPRAKWVVESLQWLVLDVILLGFLAALVERWSSGLDRETWCNTEKNRSRKSVDFFLTAQESGNLLSFGPTEKSSDEDGESTSVSGSSCDDDVGLAEELDGFSTRCNSVPSGRSVFAEESLAALSRSASAALMSRRLSFKACEVFEIGTDGECRDVRVLPFDDCGDITLERVEEVIV